MKEYSNAFEILTQEPKEIENLNMRSKMMDAIVNFIKKNEWTQQEAAEKLEVSQPRISNLTNGRLSKFSVDMLMGMLTKLGYSFDLEFSSSEENIIFSANIN